MSNFKKIIASEEPILVDFFADWCGPCQTLGPILQEVKDELGEGIRVLKVNVDQNPGLAAKYNVRGVPTMIIFKNSEIKWRQSGVLPKNQIIAAIQNH